MPELPDTPEPWPDLAVAATGPSEAALLAGLDPTQADAVAHPFGPLLVVAGPGSGKTRVLTHRVAAMLDRGVPAHRVLAVTFTNKAAAEMRTRLEAMVGPDVARRLWVCTVHAACVRILRASHVAAGVPKGFVIADASDTERLLRKVTKEAKVVADDEVSAYARAARGVISATRNRRLSLPRAAAAAGLHRLVEVEAEYRTQLRASGALDFDDLLVVTHQLLTTNDAARAWWASRWLFVAQDEAQDANLVQSELIAALASVHRNVTFVGDLDQSIYRFRGAEPEALARFTQDWPDGDVVALGHNYRSTASIVAAAASVIAGNEAVHRAVQSASHDAGEAVQLHRCRTDRDEASWVTSQVRALGGPLGEHAVLVRTNAQTRVLEEALLAARLPYQLIGDVRFYDRAEIRDTMAWLRLALNPKDVLAFERASTAPRRGIGPTTLQRVFAAASLGGDLVAATRVVAAEGGRGASALAGFADAIDAVADAATEGPAAAVAAALATGLRDQWATDANAESRLENLDELVAAAATFATSGIDAEGQVVAELEPLAATAAFLEHAALVAAADDEAVDAVPVMTIHAAKGREFDHVYVVGLEEELLPHAHSVDDPRDIAEERRLLFVAMTRARRRLFLSYAGERFRFGRRADAIPSRFLAELPAAVEVTGDPRPAYQPSSWGASTRPRASGSWASGASRSASSSGSSSPRTPRRPGLALPTTPRPTPPPPPAGPRLAPAELAAGTRVCHGVFGPGAVTSAAGTTVKVRFDDGSSRTLDLTYAPLELDR